MPAFTYKTMVIPEVGPPDNALRYGSGSAVNRMSEFFSPDMPADKLMGIVPETLRRRPGVHRSRHPILSFAGVNAEAALNAKPWLGPCPAACLALDNGWVLLLGVNHTTNTSIHYAERMVNRKQFTRWALTPAGVMECPGFPGCSDGFQALSPHVAEIARSVLIGQALVTAVPIQGLVETVGNLIAADPLALLCERPECERCSAVRASVMVKE
jgi:aminoglycoside 3-N-acetyltransferase